MTYIEQNILADIVNQLPPDQVLMLTPSDELQERISLLLYYSKKCCLSFEHEDELKKYLALEHQIRMAKIHAYQQLVSSTSAEAY
jgi:hypothetical protein